MFDFIHLLFLLIFFDLYEKENTLGRGTWISKRKELIQVIKYRLTIESI